MKIAIISDLHLGFRQYGSMDRENDFYNQFHKVCDEINKCNSDIVIIAGDLFDKPNPSPAAINAYRDGISKLNADIVCSIKGNHTMLLRDNHFSIDEYFATDELEGYYYLDDMQFDTKDFAMQSPYDIEFKKYIDREHVIIDGITYRNNSDIDEFLDIQKMMALQTPSFKTREKPYKILVVHQSFKEFCGFIGEELSIEDINYDPYDVIICGHIHQRFDTVLSDGTKFVQPGSIERMNTTEALDEQKNGKGFYLLDTEENSLEFHQVECDRKFFLGDVKFKSKEDLENHLEELNNSISKLDVPPIISYKYENIGLNIDDVRENIGAVADGILLNKSHIDDKSQEDISIEITENEMPTVIEALKMYGSESGLNDDELSLTVDLFNALSGKSEDIEDILDKYQNKHKKEYIKEELYDDELKEIIEYFGE